MRSMVGAGLAKPKHRAIGWPLGGHFCPFGPNKSVANTHWRAFWGVFYRLENNKTLVTGEWDAMY